MKKKRVQEKPALGGLSPIKKNNIVYLEKLTKNVVCSKAIFSFRDKPNNHIDFIEVYGKIETKHEDGTLISSVNNGKPIFVIRDKGAFVEYDRFTETLFNQEDIDNPAYIVDEDGSDPPKVIRIYWIDGQIDDGDGNMIDNEIDIEPYQKKGRIDESTRVVLVEAFEPLADVQTNIGDYLKDLIKDQFNLMY